MKGKVTVPVECPDYVDSQVVETYVQGLIAGAHPFGIKMGDPSFKDEVSEPDSADSREN